MSLLDLTMEETAVPDYAFYKLFKDCANIQDISGLKLPATEVGAYAYANMFEGCNTLKSSATSTPELPATTIGAYCYQNLFQGWTALTKAPELPATTLEEGCYSGMFKGCTSLTTAPVFCKAVHRLLCSRFFRCCMRTYSIFRLRNSIVLHGQILRCPYRCCLFQAFHEFP